MQANLLLLLFCFVYSIWYLLLVAGVFPTLHLILGKRLHAVRSWELIVYTVKKVFIHCRSPSSPEPQLGLQNRPELLMDTQTTKWLKKFVRISRPVLKPLDQTSSTQHKTKQCLRADSNLYLERIPKFSRRTIYPLGYHKNRIKWLKDRHEKHTSMNSIHIACVRRWLASYKRHFTTWYIWLHQYNMKSCKVCFLQQVDKL